MKRNFINLGRKVNFIKGDRPTDRQQLSAAPTQPAPAQAPGHDLAWALRECRGDMDQVKARFPEIWKAEAVAFQGRYEQRVIKEGGRAE